MIAVVDVVVDVVAVGAVGVVGVGAVGAVDDVGVGGDRMCGQVARGAQNHLVSRSLFCYVSLWNDKCQE
jgi:hypothetical protein